MKSVLAAMVLVFSVNCEASSVIDRPIEETVNSAEALARLTIISIAGNCESTRACGRYTYLASVDSILAGRLTGDDQRKVWFCSLLPLRAGTVYTAAISRSEADVARDFGCAYAVLPDAAFEKRGRHYYRINSMQTSLIVSYGGETYWTDAVRVPGFEAELKRLGVPKGLIYASNVNGAESAAGGAEPLGEGVPMSLNVPVVLFRSGSPIRGEELRRSLGEPLRLQLEGLQIVRDLLIANPSIKVRLLGFSDSLECDGTACEDLSLNRAEAVRTWMTDQGVNPASISTLEGRGDGFPVADNATPEGRQANRRIEFDFVFPDEW